MPPHIIDTTPAQRLRRLLGVKDKSHSRAMNRHRHGVRVDALEPRVMLSAEWMALPGALDRHQTFLVEPSFHPEQSSTTFMPLIDGLTRQAQETKTNEVLFVDAGVQDSQQLVSDLLASRNNGATPTFMDVVVLDAASDGLNQIGQWLSQRSDIRAVHVISHGSDGVLQIGNSMIDAQVLSERAADVAAWSGSLTQDADFLIYGCDVAKTAQGQSMLDQLARLTGADVAASVDVTAGVTADWDLEFHTGLIESATLSTLSYKPTLAIAAADLKLSNDDASVSDASKVSLQEQWLTALNGLEAVIDLALADALINQKLPGLNMSVNEMLRLDTASNTSEQLLDWQLAQAASSYFVAAATEGGANLAGLAVAVETRIKALLLPTGGSNLPWVVKVSAQVVDVNGTPTARLALDLSVLVNDSLPFAIGAAGQEGGIPNIANFDGSEMGQLSTRVSAVLVTRIDMAMASLASGAAGANFLYEGSSNGSATANLATRLVLERFDLGVQAKTGANAPQGFAYDLQAGVSARLRADDGTLGVTLTDWLANGSSRLDVTHQSSLVGRAAAGTGSNDLTPLKTDTKGLIGVVDAGVLRAQTINDIRLLGSVNSGFGQVMNGMARLGSQIDGQAEFNRSLPMVDLNYTQLLTLNDGRTLGDVLAFKLAGGGNVLTDYVSSTNAPTLTGLIDRLRQYLSGTGELSLIHI